MKELTEKVNQRIKMLEKIITEKERAINQAPGGWINVHASANGRPSFYFKPDLHSHQGRKYLSIKELPLVKQLIQKDYDEKVLKHAKKELSALNAYQRVFKKQVIEDIYPKLNKHRQALINPTYLPDEEFIKQWMAEEYEPKGFKEDYPVYYTDKGERVRSKSEVLIANALNKHNIPYHYEKPLKLKQGLIIYPDFTILNIKKRRTIYFEHFGLMDDPNYVEKFLRKIETYEDNNIFPGDKLIFTLESAKYPINLKNLKQLINQYLK